jgi:hypothetical protein
MKRKKKLTRKQKRQMNPEGSGNSKYARKIGKRKKAAIRAGLRPNATWPEIWAIRQNQ